MAIRILPENLANQIAAGEVVERPASVVKELLENAVDAGARNISVQVEGRALGVIRVGDDGRGMDPDDLLLCLERHATSKIADAADLAAINTLGFRGEALPSIASVSRLTLTSRPAGADLGSRVEVRFGVVRRVLEAGAAVGTTVEVADLFANVPARRKFLKTARTELYHLEECVKSCALAFPAMGVLYQVDGRTVLHWPAGVDDQEGRVRRLLRGGAVGEMLVLDSPPSEPGGVGVSGLLLAPEDLPATGSRLRLFVNNRPVRERMISHAVAEALHNQLLRGRQPAGVLFLRVDPATVDVNVHPTKQEIRLQQPNLVHQAVVLAVQAALERHERQRGRALFGPSLAEERGFGQVDEVGASLRGAEGAVVSDVVSDNRESKGTDLKSDYVGGGTGAQLSVSESANGGFSSFVPATDRGRSGQELSPPQQGVSGQARGSKGTDFNSVSDGADCADSGEEVEGGPLRLLGQVLRSYIICAAADGLLAVDQHAAHERLLYQRLLDQYHGRGVASQRLLFPAVVECSPAEASLLEERGEEIGRLGLELENFGGNSFVVKAVPSLLAAGSPEEVVAGVLGRYGDGSEGAGGAKTRLESVLAGMACKAAVKAGQRLEEAEMEGLLQEMQAAGIFSRCPHGRPVVRRFGAEEMKKWFNR